MTFARWLENLLGGLCCSFTK